MERWEFKGFKEEEDMGSEHMGLSFCLRGFRALRVV